MRPGDQPGFTYLIALLLTGVCSASALAAAQVWSTAQQREKEAELIWIGNQFVQAIGSYYERSPGTVKRYPEKLEDLGEDHRYLSMQRHLRKIYRDPITGTTDWGIVRAPDGGIMGVYSRLDQHPIKSIGNQGASRYRDWKFLYQPTPKQSFGKPQT